MDFRVVCISRTIAAGGEDIGQVIAQRLGFRYVDEQIIERAARLAQVDPKLIADTEHRQPVLQRLLDKLAAAYELAGPMTLATGVPIDAFVPAPGARRATPDDLRALIRAAIHEVAKAGQAVIVAHAASMALAGTESVLRVLVTASADTRARRLATAGDIGAADAAQAVTASDRERRDYFQRFYGIKDELPTHYDLLINTDVLTAAHAAEIILAATRSAEALPTNPSRG
jgi:hypothetical protein